MKSATIFIAALLGATGLSAQDIPTEIQTQWNEIKANIAKAADRMSEADYAFKPEGEPRTFAQLIAHVADTHGAICGAVKGEQKRFGAGEKTSKADLVAVLKASDDYCDSAYATLSDANMNQKVTIFGGMRTLAGALGLNVIHDNEVYGSIAVYMRMKGVVPPSTADRPQRQGKKKQD